jgi:uncharacterized membrane protein
MKKLNLEIQINSSQEKVWDTITDDKKYREWTSVFQPTSYFEGGWNTGDKINFVGIDEKGEKGGMVSEIAESRKPEYISIRHLGYMQNGGCLLLFTSKITITNVFYSFTAEELLEDPNDFIVNFLGQVVQNISLNTKIFIAFYILIHGITNLFLAIQLYRNRLWSYLLAIIIMGVFMLYQAYRISLYHSVPLIIITIFDFFFILLTWHEYHHRKPKLSLNY